MANSKQKKLKVEEAYFQEKSLGDLTRLRFEGSPVRPEDRLVFGEHKKESYIYAETGMLSCALSGKIRKLKNVTLIYSNDDVYDSINSVTNVRNFCNSLSYEKLHRKSRNGLPIFNSKCDLCYVSGSKSRIKNFLICIDGAKKGYDLFVLQTFQSPLGNYFTSFSIDENKDIISYKMSIPTRMTKKRDSGITNRVVMLDNLNAMMKPFFVNGIKVTPGDETEAFKSFISSFKSVYELWKL